jgi:radical SAM superfamily enzyme YgiQ (UPF0313 family)
MNSLGNVTKEFLEMIKLPSLNGKTLNYLIVIPHKITNKYAFPAGLGIVAAALKASERIVHTINLDIYDPPLMKLEEEITNHNIDVLMIGGFSVEYREIYSILKATKRIKPNIITVVGGGIISADPITSMIALEYADYGIIGEGEITVNSLAYALENDEEISDIPGVVYFKGGKWHFNSNFPEIRNLDLIPYPDYKGFEFDKILYNDTLSNKWTRRSGSNKVIYLNITRSCPFLCTFCFHTCGNHYRRMSMDSIFNFLDWILQQYPDIEALSFDGELTFSDEAFAIEFCRRIAPYNLKWRANTRADVLTEKMLSSMKNSGCNSVMFGIESADNAILKSMKKRTTIEQVERAFQIADDVDIYARGTLIFGDPEETESSLQKTIDWYLEHRKWSDIDNFWNITLGLIKAYPGTLLYKQACEKGLIKNQVQFLKDGCPPINLSKLPQKVYDDLPNLFQQLYKR